MSVSITSPSSEDLALLRAHPIRVPKHRLSVAPRVAVLSGQITALYADQETNGLYAAEYDSATGSYTDVREGMTIDFGSTPGARDLGSRRVRWEEATSSTISFSESAPASLKIAVGSYFTVVNEHRPFIVMPRGVGTKNGTTYTNGITLYMDYNKPYTDENFNFKPKVNITRSATSLLAPHPAGWCLNDGKRRMTLSGAKSQNLSHTGANSQWEWDIADGELVSGDLDSGTITVDFPPGFRYIALRVYDTVDTEGVMYYPIWAHDESYPPLTRFTKTRDVTNEWREIDFDFFAQETDELIIPKGTTLCYWKEPGFEPPPLYRAQALGWAVEDTTIFSKTDPRSSLTLMGLGGWLNRFRPFPQQVYDPFSALGSWFHMDGITLDRLAYYVLLNMSTAMQIGNFYRLYEDGDEEILLKALDITGSSIWGHVKYILSGYSGRVGSDSLNTIWLSRHYSYMTEAERAANDPILALTAADFADKRQPKIVRRYNKPVGQVLGGGSTLNGQDNELYASTAPGHTPDDGTDSPEAPYQNLPTTDPQGALNWLTGQHLAYLNNDRSAVELAPIYPLDIIEPAHGLPISVTNAYSSTGLELNDDLFLAKEVSLSQSDPRSREEVVISTEGVTQGEPGEYTEVPEEPTPPDYQPPTDIEPYPTTTPVSRVPLYTGSDQVPTKLVGLDALGAHAARAQSWNPLTGAITWEDISTGLTGTGIWLTADPYDYRRYFALMTTGLFRCDNVWAASPSWSLVASVSTMFGGSFAMHNVQMSINRRGWIAVNSGAALAVSFDYGSTWTQRQMTGASFTPTNDLNVFVPSFVVSPHNSATNGVLYCASGIGFTGSDTIYKSTDWGLTWTAICLDWGNDFSNCARLNVPYIRVDGVTPNINDGSQEVWLICGNKAQGGELRFSNNAGVSYSAKLTYTTVNGSAPMTNYRGVPIQTFTWDGARVQVATSRIGNSAFGSGVLISNDAGATADYISTVGNPSGTGDYESFVNGFPLHKEFTIFWKAGGNEGELLWTFDDGANWVEGTMPSFFAFGGQFGIHHFFANVQADLSDYVPAA